MSPVAQGQTLRSVRHSRQTFGGSQYPSRYPSLILIDPSFSESPCRPEVLPHPADRLRDHTIVQVDVALCALHIAVPERATDQHEIPGGLVEECAEGMAKGMNGESLLDPRPTEPERKPLLDSPCGQRAALPGGEQGLISAGTRHGSATQIPP